MTTVIRRNLATALTAGAAGLFLLTGCAGSTAETETAGASATETATASPSADPSPGTEAGAGSDPDASTDSGADPSAGTGTVTAPPAATPAPDSPGAGTPAAAPEPAGSCTTATLTAALETPEGAGAAGSTYRSIVLTNTGASSCTLEGFPVVTYADAAGAPIGAEAVMDDSAESGSVNVPAGGKATAQLRESNAGFFDEADCVPVPATQLLITIGGGAPLAVAHEAQACSGPGPEQLSVGPYEAA